MVAQSFQGFEVFNQSRQKKKKKLKLFQAETVILNALYPNHAG